MHYVAVAEKTTSSASQERGGYEQPLRGHDRGDGAALDDLLIRIQHAVDRDHRRSQGFCIELALVQQFHEAWDIAHRIGAAILAGVMRAAADGKHHGGQGQVSRGKAGSNYMAARSAHHVRLLDGENPGGIGPSFELGFRAIGAHGLHDKVRAGAAQKAARVASAGPEPVIRAIRELTHFVHQLVALDIRIQDVRCADLQG